ncbi:MAG: glutathione S-transferase family protein, partial [Myxococcota bacterium]
MSLEVYWGSGSTPAWRVLLALTLKELPYTSHLLSFSKRETRTPAFLALNPRGQVPVLVHDGFVLNESLAILAYLDRAFPERPLFGTTAREHGETWRLVEELQSYGREVFDPVARPLLFGKADESADAIRAAVPALVAELDLLEKRVAGGAMVGGNLGAADIVWFCAVSGLVRALTRPAAAPLGLGLYP